MTTGELRAPAYQLFMLALCVLALGILLFDAVFRLDPEISRVLGYADNLVCALFLLDFCISFVRAPNKLRYFFTWGWLDLLSAIPMLDQARWGRIARIARLARVLRAWRASRVLTQLLYQQRGRSAALAASLLTILLIVACSAAMLHFEDPSEGNIKSAQDAIWWSFTTITTVGYGDKFPLSPEGRIVAAILMTAGVGLFGAFSAALAAWFLSPGEAASDQEIAALRAEVAALRELLETRLPK